MNVAEIKRKSGTVGSPHRGPTIGLLGPTWNWCYVYDMHIDAEQYFELVKQDVFSARIEWRLYRSLFGTNPETVEF